MSSPSFIKQHPTASALLFFAILVAVFYGNTLGNGFIFDDFGIVERNENLRSLGNIHKVITSCLWELEDNGCKTTSYPYYRPVYYLSVFLTYQISSQPWIFHLFNLVYFTLAAYVLFLFVRRLTKNFSIGFLTALFFIIHPVNSEVVNWMALSADSALLIFGGLTLIFYLKYRESHRTHHLRTVSLLYFLALLSKEPAILIPLAVLMIDVFFLHDPWKKILQYTSWKKYLIFLIPTIIYAVMRVSVLGFAVGGKGTQFTFLEAMWARIVLFAQYVKEFFYPYPLSIYHHFEKSSDFLSSVFLFSFAVLIIFGLCIFFALKKRQNLIAFSLIWFFLFLFPTLLTLVGEDNSMLAERYLYMACIGPSIIIAHFISRALLVSGHMRYGILIGIGAVMVLSWAIVFPRNNDWNNEELLHIETLKDYPDAHRIRRGLAQIYFSKGDDEGARSEYEELIGRAPTWKDITMAYKGLGDYWLQKGDKDQALASYLQSTQTAHMQPRDYVPFQNVAMLEQEKGEDLLAFTYFCQSLQLFQTDQTQQSFQTSLQKLQDTIIKQNTLISSLKDKFQSVQEKNIQYLDKRCDDKKCQFAFAFNPQSKDIIAPPLLTAFTQTPSQRYGAGKKQQTTIPITNSSFDPTQNVIILEADPSYKDTDITFLFPTCGRAYYEVGMTPAK